MQRAELLKGRTKAFALEIIRYSDKLPGNQTRDILIKQLIRSATSVGANYRAACRARSRAEFAAKIHIALEEADETQYWLELLYELNTNDRATIQKLLNEAGELTAILTASFATLRKEN